MTSTNTPTVTARSRAGEGKRNEDCHGQRTCHNGLLLVVADGMGSTECAHEAAELAVKSVVDTFDESLPVEGALRGAVLKANERIAAACLERRCKMGCAIAVAYVHGERLSYVTLGNVRIYLHRQNLADCVTHDDVYVASNGNRFLTRSVSGKDLDGKIKVMETVLKEVTSISLETDGHYLQDAADDATIAEIHLI